MANETEQSAVAQEITDANVETEQSSTTEQKETKTAEGKMTDVIDGKKAGEDAKAGEGKEDGKKEDAPEVVGDDWTPTLPEGVTLDEDMVKESRELLKGLPKEQAQKLADFQVKQAQKAQEATREAWEKQVKAWEDGVKADPEFKDGFDAKKAIANKGYNELFTPEERDYLTKSGLSSYLFRAMYKAGKKIAEPSGEPEGKAGKQPAGGDAYDRLAGNFK